MAALVVALSPVVEHVSSAIQDRVHGLLQAFVKCSQVPHDCQVFLLFGQVAKLAAYFRVDEGGQIQRQAFDRVLLPFSLLRLGFVHLVTTELKQFGGEEGWPFGFERGEDVGERFDDEPTGWV